VIEFIEIAERARSGPRVDEKDWNMMLFKKMQTLTKEYNINCQDVDEFLNTDNSTADAAFQAAIDFIVDMGAFCISTNRVIKFDEYEVKQALRDAPNQVHMGEGRDARIFKQGKIDGNEPININPGHHAPFTEDNGSLVVKNFAQIPRTDFIEGFNFPAVDGRDCYHQPFEAYAAIREIAWMREGVRKAGRPGLAIVLYPITTKASSLIAPMNPQLGLRPTDGLLMSTLPDVKVEYDHITTAIVYSSYGYFSVNGSFGMAGGFCGGPEGAMIEGIVRPIIGYMCYGDTLHYCGVEHIGYVMGERIIFHPMNWARSVVYQAINRNSNLPHFPRTKRMIRIIAGLSRQVECNAQTRLALLKQIAVTLVGLPGRPEARILTHGPEAAPVHGGFHSSREGIFSRKAEFKGIIEVFIKIRRCI